MRSKLAKVLHPLLGRPMLQYALEAAQQVSGAKPIVVVGRDAEAVQQTFGRAADFVLQEAQLGTGHAVMQAEPLLPGVVWCDSALETASDALQIMGGYGYMHEYGMEKRMRDAKTLQLEGGPTPHLVTESICP